MKKHIAVLLITLLGTVSCMSVLDKEPLDIISDEVVWKDPVLIDLYLRQCYAEMSFFNEMQYGGNQDDVSSGNNPMIALGMADETHSAWVPTPKSHWINSSGGVYEWWGYPVVRRLNIFIERLPSSPIDGALQTNRIAEARFLRAFSYFQMVKRYGGVPLLTKALKLDDPDELLYSARNKEDDIYQFIINELNDIIDNKMLPESYGGGDLGRPTIWAAAALKSRTAMYAGSIATWGRLDKDGIVGVPIAKAEYYWQQSLDASNLIINQGPFALYTKYLLEDPAKNYRNLFLDENNCEVIFSEVYDGKVGKGHSWDHWQNPAAFNAWNEGQANVVYLEFIESYENTDGSDPQVSREKIASYHQWTMDELFGKKDPRFKASIYTHLTPWTHNGESVALDYHQGVHTGTTWIEDGMVPNGVPGAGLPAQGKQQSKWRPSAFGVLKYLDEAAAMVPERLYSDTDWIIFRLGEIYINKAEAAYQLNKKDESRDAINKIRKRAGMPDITGSITLEQIRHERKIELAFEGNRYWDVRRWRTAVKDLSHTWNGLRYKLDGTSATGTDITKYKFYVEILPNICGFPAPYFNELHYYMPIAQWRLNQNPNFVPNPGYN